MALGKHARISIGLFIVVGIALCLLWLLHTHSLVSYRTKPPPSESKSLVATTSVPVLPATIASSTIRFEVVRTVVEQQQGLSGREVIPDNYGMLFVFAQKGKYGFWMKDMLASIDMVWLTDKGAIVSITPSVTPATYPNVFYPPYPIKFVIETQAGFAARQGWKIGTVVPIPPTVL